MKRKQCAHYDKRMNNGWKNSGSPWVYDFNPELIWISVGHVVSHGPLYSNLLYLRKKR
jgi:hypothetical protein